MVIYDTHYVHDLIADSDKDLVYEVVYKDGNGQEGKIVDEVIETNLGYAANCPVTVTNNDDGSEVEGTVLLCEPSPSDPSTFLYTVMVMVDDFQARYEDGIDAKRIKHRKVKSDATNDERSKPAAVSVANDQKEGLLTTNNPAASGCKLDSVGAVPLSITCDSFAEKDNTLPKPDLASPLTATTATSKGRGLQVDTAQTNRSSKSESCRSLNNFSHASDSSRGMNGFAIEIPQWLQRDRLSQRNLFCKFDFHPSFMIFLFETMPFTK